MACYTKAAMERAMKGQEVILRVLAKKITWWQAAEIIGIPRTCDAGGSATRSLAFAGCLTGGRGKLSPKPGHLHLLRAVFCCGLRRYCFRRAKPRIFAPQLLDQKDT